jgi:uncharacterized protein (DUF2141 family)
MKKLFIALLVGYPAMTQAQNVSLIVNINQFKSNEGLAYVSLQEPSKKVVQYQSVKIEKNETQVIFRNLKPGKYAVRLFHDANNNGKLDTDFLGMPKESWGCSNNVKPHFAAPKFENMLFILDKDQIIFITMN